MIQVKLKQAEGMKVEFKKKKKKKKESAVPASQLVRKRGRTIFQPSSNKNLAVTVKHLASIGSS